MAPQTYYRLCPTHAEAVQVVADLAAAGLSRGDIALIDNEEDARLPQGATAEHAQDPAGVGATLGATIGAGVGVLAGIGAITLPLMGPFVTAGWLVPSAVLALAGTVCGGLLGLVARRAMPADLRGVAEGLQRGNTLVLVTADEPAASAVRAVLKRPHAAPPPALFPLAGPADPSVADPQAAIWREERRIQYEGVHAGLDNPPAGL